MTEPLRIRPGIRPPRWPTASELRKFLSENVTVVKPGETLVIQVGQDWTSHQVMGLHQALNAGWDEGDPYYPFRVLVVPGTGLGVVQADGA